MKKWFFQDRPAGARTGQDDNNVPPGLVSLPEELLERHGARVLDPGKAAAVPGYPTPRPTIYLARTLLVPDHLLQNTDFVDAANRALEDSGMELIAPPPDPDQAEGQGEIFQELQQLPRVAVLVPRAGSPTPVVVDAWVALQALRAAAASPDHPDLDQPTVDQIGLEHVHTGASITGTPIGNGGGGITGNPGGSGGVSVPSPTDSYMFWGDARAPVAVLFDPPAYKSDAQVESDHGGRAVVAVLDTGLGANEVLGVAPDGSGGYAIAPGSPVADDTSIQAAIYAEGQHAVAHGARPRRLIHGVWDKPMTANPLVGELNPALGHGTFIAGIIRQVAPDARILAVRIMESDDVAYEGDALCALRHLAKRIALHAEGDVAAMVQVVSLSWGHFSESPGPVAPNSGLWRVIRLLLRLGVIVVAAAGNYATSREFFPAAFATQTVPPDEVPVISVGALNPNGTKAMFTDDGDWVMCFALGAAVLSTYPTDIHASRSPQLRMPGDPMPSGGSWPERAALKPDDFADGWALWSGTSFSAPYIAALVIKLLQESVTVPEGATPQERAAIAELWLDQPARKARAVAAWENLRQQGRQGE
jgi:Subtilase family